MPLRHQPVMRNLTSFLYIARLADEAINAREEENNALTEADQFPIITYDEAINKTSTKNLKKYDNEDFPGSPMIKEHHSPLMFDPEDLIDLYVYDTYTTKNGNTRERKGRVKEQVNGDAYRVEFKNGKQKVYDYEEIIALANRSNEDDVKRWTFERIIDHQRSKEVNWKGKIDLLVKWSGYEEPTWEPLEVMKTDNPVTVAKYARDDDLLNKSMWKWARRYAKNDKKFHRMLRQMNLQKRKRTGIKYQFGVRVPRTLKEAHLLDQMNGNTFWGDAIKKEVKLLKDTYTCFCFATEEDDLKTYKCIKLIWVFAAKFDGHRRARCVSGGHMTNDLEVDLYSGVVNLETARLAFVATVLMDLNVVAADIARAYIQALTIEKVFVIAGPKFGADEGRILIIVKALYGLKSSGAVWHQKCGDSLRSLGLEQSKADYDLWIRKNRDHCKYMAIIVDDLLVFSKNQYRSLNLSKHGLTMN